MSANGNGHEEAISNKQLREHLLALAKEHGLLATPKLRQIGEDDDEPEPRFVPVDTFFAQCGERVDYLLEPYIPKAAIVLVIAPPKAGKTWFVSWLEK